MKRNAFTLIELLLAVMLMALILGAIYGVIWAGVRTRQAISDETDALCSLNSAVDVIQNDLQKISCRPKALRILPLLQSGGLIMQISALPASTDDDPQKIYIFLMPATLDASAKLVRHVEPDTAFAEACSSAAGETTTVLTAYSGDENDFEILLEPVEIFRLRCPAGENVWLENSYDIPALPCALEITLATKTAKGKVLSVTRWLTLPVGLGPVATTGAGQ